MHSHTLKTYIHTHMHIRMYAAVFKVSIFLKPFFFNFSVSNFWLFVYPKNNLLFFRSYNLFSAVCFSILQFFSFLVSIPSLFCYFMTFGFMTFGFMAFGFMTFGSLSSPSLLHTHTHSLMLTHYFAIELTQALNQPLCFFHGHIL